MTHGDVEKWRAEAEKVKNPELPGSVPVDVLVGEAVEVAKFVERYWKPEGERPGLKDAGRRLAKGVGGEIVSLRAAVQEAETTYRLVVEPEGEKQGLIARGRFVLDELTATIEWVLDDDVAEEADLQLKSVKDAHQGDTGRADQLAQALHDYGTLAREIESRLEGVGGFDKKMIDEAFQIANDLGAVRATPAPPSARAQEALRLRNGLATLLQDKVALVRSAARFVFRHHPEIIREVTSPYERRRRAEARRRAAKPAAPSAPAPTPSTGGGEGRGVR